MIDLDNEHTSDDELWDEILRPGRKHIEELATNNPDAGDRNKLTECYSCVHRQPFPGATHIRCAYPDPEMEGDEHGIKKGWFNYPMLFDPCWKTRLCNHYKPKDGAND